MIGNAQKRRLWVGVGRADDRRRRNGSGTYLKVGYSRLLRRRLAQRCSGGVRAERTTARDSPRAFRELNPADTRPLFEDRDIFTLNTQSIYIYILDNGNPLRSLHHPLPLPPPPHPRLLLPHLPRHHRRPKPRLHPRRRHGPGTSSHQNSNAQPLIHSQASRHLTRNTS